MCRLVLPLLLTRKCIDKHVEFVQDAMEIDATESRTLNLIAGDSAPLSSDVKLACSSLPQSMELFDTSLEDTCPDQTSYILGYAKAYAKYDTGCTSGEKEDRAPLDHGIPFGSDAPIEDKCLDRPDDIQLDSEALRDTAELLGCSPGWRDDEKPLTLAVQLSSGLCKDIVPQQQVMEDKTEQNMDENIEQTMEHKVVPSDRKARIMISVEHTPHGQDTSSTAFCL